MSIRVPIVRSPVQPVVRSPLLGPLTGRGGGGELSLENQVAAMFGNGEKGWIIAPGAASAAMYTERTGASATTPAGDTDGIGTYHDTVNDIYFTASADARRPTLNISGGLSNADFDGSDDCLVGPSIDFSASPSATIVQALELDDSGTRIITEFSINAGTQAGAFAVFYDNGTGRLSFILRDTASRVVGYAIAPPQKFVMTCILDISQADVEDQVMLRIDGVDVSLSFSGVDAGSANFGNHVPYIGARADSSLRFNGRKWLDMAIARTLTSQEITTAEAWASELST